MNSHHGAAAHGAPFDFVTLILLVVPVLLLGLYLAAAAVQSRRRRWSIWRTTAFVLGSATVIVALLPPLAPLAHGDLRAHMFQHLLIGMLGPIGLVLGAPVTLALRTLPAPTARKAVALLRSRPVHWLTHPVSALVLNIGGMVLLYVTPIYAAMLHWPLLHLFVHLHFLAAGCLFSWAIAGIDAGPARKSHLYRLVVLFFAMAIHAGLSKAMYVHGWPRGTGHAASEIQQAAKIMYYGGDLSELILAVVLFSTWSATWSLTAHRPRRAESSTVLAPVRPS